MSNVSTPKLTKKQIKHELWRRGELSFKCHIVQKEMYDLFYKAEPYSISVWLLARRSGKSTLFAILALEAAIRNPNSIVKLVTDTRMHLKSIFEPIFRDLLEDCPDDIKPTYHTSTYIYTFPNGSQIQLAGSDAKNYEKLRGQSAQLVLVDEAGFCRDLDDMIYSVLLPTTTHTGGKIVLASTPPPEMNHPFINFMEKAEIEGKLVKKTVYDNPTLNPETIKAIEDRMGKDSPEFKREYLCVLIQETSNVVLPEVTDELLSEIVREWPKPPFFESYESMDLGFQDLTAVLFGYYDFRAKKIIIEDELPFDFKEQDKHIELLTKEIINKENKLWNNIYTNEIREPSMRVSDINLIVTNEIRRYSNGRLNFINARKDDKDSAINDLRVLLANKKIIINPRCQTLIRHLKNCKWDKSKNKFARCPDDSHYDFVDALIYMVRSVNFNKNPYPSDYELDFRRDDLFVSQVDSFKKKHDTMNVYKAIFGLNRRK